MRIFRLLLRLYPASFRADHSEEMAAIFRLRLREARGVSALGVWMSAIQEVIVNAPAAHWDMLTLDLRYTVRSLIRARGFALTAILVTALGVGANTAAFSVADFVLFRPLPYPDADRVVRLCEGPKEGGGWGCMNQLSPANYRDFRAMATSFSGMGAFAEDAVNLVGGGEPQRLPIARVTPDVFPLLGVTPALGRVFDPAGTDTGAVVLSHGVWQSQFGGDPGVLGRVVNLHGAPHTIIGVMPATFYFPTRQQVLWAPLTFRTEDYRSRDNSYIEAVARLKPDATFDAAHAELRVIADRLSRAYPETNEETGVSFFRMRDNMSPRIRLMLTALGGATLCLLLLTCANLANLLLARATARERELAVRAALGAGRERLVRQLVTESVILTAAGGAAGVAVAAAGLPLFSNLVPTTLPIASQPVLDLRVFVLAAVFTALTGLGFGLVPALRAARGTAFAALRDGARAGGGQKRRARALLVTVEVTMSVILLITSGLLIRAISRVQAIDPGFVAANVLTIKTALPRPKYDNRERRGAYYDRVLAGVRALPGVHSAAFVTGLPMALTGIVTSIDVAGQDARTSRANPVSHRWVTPQYFAAMGIPFRQGRDVDDADTAERPWVAVVSASFAERYWPGQDPIGRTFRHRGEVRRVVGVVGDVKVRGLERVSEPQMYLPAAQMAPDSPPNIELKDLVIRHSGSGDALVPAIRGIVRDADPEQPISNVRPMAEVLAGDTATRRAQLQVLGTLAVVAVLLAGVGVYGLLSYTVSQRAQEIGVRLALGADPSRVGWMVFADGMRLAAFGIVPGAMAAYAAGRSMSALLFGVTPGDPATFASGIGAMLVIALAGSLVPALRAVRVSPLEALKAD